MMELIIGVIRCELLINVVWMIHWYCPWSLVVALLTVRLRSVWKKTRQILWFYPPTCLSIHSSIHMSILYYLSIWFQYSMACTINNLSIMHPFYINCCPLSIMSSWAIKSKWFTHKNRDRRQMTGSDWGRIWEKG